MSQSTASLGKNLGLPLHRLSIKLHPSLCLTPLNFTLLLYSRPKFHSTFYP